MRTWLLLLRVEGLEWVWWGVVGCGGPWGGVGRLTAKSKTSPNKIERIEHLNDASMEFKRSLCGQLNNTQ